MTIIISSAVDGVELGALYGANQLGLETGGTAPATTINHHRFFRLLPSKSHYWWLCTVKNVQAANGVVWISKQWTVRAEAVRIISVQRRKPLLILHYDHMTTTGETMLRQAKALARFLQLPVCYITGNKQSANSPQEGYAQWLVMTAAQELRHPGCLPDAMPTSRTRKTLRNL